MTGDMDTNKSGGSTAGRTPRSARLRIALIASLALNLFLAGVIGVWVARPFFHEPPGPTVAMRGMMNRMAARLPEADRPILRQAFAKRQDEITRLFQEARQAQQAVRATLRAEPFDPAAYDAAFERARQARAAVEVAVHGATRDAVMAMSHEGRVKLTQRRRSRN